MPQPQESNGEQPKKKLAHMTGKERREARLKQRASMLERRKLDTSTKNSRNSGAGSSMGAKKAGRNGFSTTQIKDCVHNQGKTGRKVGAG